MSTPSFGGAAIAALLTSALLAAPALGDGDGVAVAPEGTTLPAAAAAAAIEPDPLFDDIFEIEIEDDFEQRDPWEGPNRYIFQFNDGIDTVFWNPVTRAYQFVVPEPGRRSLRRVFLNLNSPAVFVNDLLQLRVRDAGKTLGRFLLNTTLGIGGLFDPALEAGWERHHSDFGQTLAKIGVGSGPYIVIPIFGPSTVRDGFGDVVDRFFQPVTYLLGFTPQIFIGSTDGLVARDAHHEQLKALRESSVDYYAAMRSAFLQNREHEIWGDDGRPEVEKAAASLDASY